MAATAPGLVSLIAQFEAATAEARSLAASTTEEVFTRRAGERRWSAADCIAHLSTTNERYLRKLERILPEAPRSAEPRYRTTLVGRIFKWLMEPPARVPLKAPKIFRPPAEARGRADVIAEFEASQARIVESLRGAGSVDFGSVSMRSPVTRLLRFNLWDAFRIMAAHERRHLDQARKAAERG